MDKHYFFKDGYKCFTKSHKGRPLPSHVKRILAIIGRVRQISINAFNRQFYQVWNMR